MSSILELQKEKSAATETQQVDLTVLLGKQEKPEIEMGDDSMYPWWQESENEEPNIVETIPKDKPDPMQQMQEMQGTLKTNDGKQKAQEMMMKKMQELPKFMRPEGIEKPSVTGKILEMAQQMPEKIKEEAQKEQPFQGMNLGKITPKQTETELKQEEAQIRQEQVDYMNTLKNLPGSPEAEAAQASLDRTNARLKEIEDERASLGIRGVEEIPATISAATPEQIEEIKQFADVAEKFKTQPVSSLTPEEKQQVAINFGEQAVQSQESLDKFIDLVANDQLTESGFKTKGLTISRSKARQKQKEVFSDEEMLSLFPEESRPMYEEMIKQGDKRVAGEDLAMALIMSYATGGITSGISKNIGAKLMTSKIGQTALGRLLGVATKGVAEGVVAETTYTGITDNRLPTKKEAIIAGLTGGLLETGITRAGRQARKELSSEIASGAKRGAQATKAGLQKAGQATKTGTQKAIKAAKKAKEISVKKLEDVAEGIKNYKGKRKVKQTAEKLFPKLTKKEAQAAFKGEGLIESKRRNILGRIFKGERNVTPTKKLLDISEVVADEVDVRRLDIADAVPELKKASQNIGKQLKPELKNVRINKAKFSKAVTDDLSDTIADIKVEISGARTSERKFRKAVDKFMKDWKGNKKVTLDDVWELRKQYDAITPDTVKSATSQSAQDVLLKRENWLNNRSKLNDLLFEIGDSEIQKGYVKKQFDKMSKLMQAEDLMLSNVTPKSLYGKESGIKRLGKSAKKAAVGIGIGTAVGSQL